MPRNLYAVFFKEFFIKELVTIKPTVLPFSFPERPPCAAVGVERTSGAAPGLGGCGTAVAAPGGERRTLPCPPQRRWVPEQPSVGHTETHR